MRATYAVGSWLLFALGVLHMASTPARFDAITSQALWFFDAGILIVLVSVLNLLNRTYGATAPGLKRVCVVTNAVNTALAVVGGVVTHATTVQLIIVVGMMISLTVLSALPLVSRPA